MSHLFTSALGVALGGGALIAAVLLAGFGALAHYSNWRDRQRGKPAEGTPVAWLLGIVILLLASILVAITRVPL